MLLAALFVGFAKETVEQIEDLDSKSDDDEEEEEVAQEHVQADAPWR